MKPIITEKTTNLYRTQRICAFSVDLNLNKYRIHDLFKTEFGIDPLSIRVLNRLGKYKRQRNNYRKYSLIGSKKIAYIKIDSKSKLDIFEIK